jgi:hypothetical protein
VFRGEQIRWDDIGTIPFDAFGAPGWEPRAAGGAGGGGGAGGAGTAGREGGAGGAAGGAGAAASGGRRAHGR